MSAETTEFTVCDGCGTPMAAALLSCPSCQRLTYAQRLNELAAEARGFEQAGDRSSALAAWREAMDLLPPGSQQYVNVSQRVAKMSRELDAGVPAPANPANPSGKRGAWGAIVAVVVSVLAKGKFLLAGLTKAGTLWTMLLSLGVYWAAWGWRFALGLVLSIYVHEMGHVAMLRRYGMKATPPMFLPGLGALIRLKQHPADSREDAMIGLAGPVWGLAAAVASCAGGMIGGVPALLAIGKVGAWINLFNLTPIGSLDGGRGFRALSRGQRCIVAIGVAGAYWISKEGLLLLVLIMSIVRIASEKGEPKGDAGILLRFLALVAALTALTCVKVKM